MNLLKKPDAHHKIIRQLDWLGEIHFTKVNKKQPLNDIYWQLPFASNVIYTDVIHPPQKTTDTPFV